MRRLAAIVSALLLTGLAATAAVVSSAPGVRAENNGVERTPVMGWSSWSYLRNHPTAATIEAQAKALSDSGLEKYGYRYVNLDDFWYRCPGSQGPEVDSYGRWVVNSGRFPAKAEPGGGTVNGIKAVADYVHSLGLKFGIYVTPGISKQAVAENTKIAGTGYTARDIAEPSVRENNYNCGGMVGIDYSKPGAQAYTNSWADMLASWGVDYVKFDGITNRDTADVKAWSAALRQTGRPMVLNITQGSYTSKIAPTLMRYANQWEFAPDIECYGCEKGGSSYPLTNWAHVANRFDYVASWQPYAGPGGFNDYDSIEVGNGGNDGLTPAERQTQLSLWALGSSPLILGVDLTHLNPNDLRYLKNTAVLAVDQDSIAARRVADHGTSQVFAKTERGGDVIVGLFNTSATARRVSVPPSAVGLPAGRRYALDNLWTHRSSTARGIGATVPAHGVVLYRVTAR
ncbi:MAG: glycoside hydrolase family 27 protein [Nocardiopsaceae bacterium]|nr:glycoside hydrolase family 27 protein [Nocardiopsaceae bacterium]